MGCGLPAAIGAALANPQTTCLAVAGDGGFAMTSQELIMAKVYKLNVKVGAGLGWAGLGWAGLGVLTARHAGCIPLPC
jgi:glyoxylate carboligase